RRQIDYGARLRIVHADAPALRVRKGHQSHSNSLNSWLIKRGKRSQYTPSTSHAASVTKDQSRNNSHGSLISARSGKLDDLRPLRNVLAEVLLELARRHGQRLRTLVVPRFLDVGPVDDLRDFGVEPVNDRPGRAGRRHDPEPDSRLVVLDARFRDR